jgi:hypothetical protein
MWNVIAEVIIVITVESGTISKSLRQYQATYQESTKLRNYKKNCHIGHCTHTTESANGKSTKHI